MAYIDIMERRLILEGQRWDQWRREGITHSTWQGHSILFISGGGDTRAQFHIDGFLIQYYPKTIVSISHATRWTCPGAERGGNSAQYTSQAKPDFIASCSEPCDSLLGPCQRCSLRA